uniref:COG1896 Predicted hydrolases of HD superfamily n=1 Tax=uncultured Caudovirales phage TaxID=2100421 RepID=A0A6J5L9H4_9CAUD|nr:COG1896 Predicted hydrolases of HD superfamily [uncultured Caudovirales phage]
MNYGTLHREGSAKFLTSTGIWFDLNAPDPQDVRIADIAWALANVNRFGGHVGACSVAVHSLNVMERFVRKFGYLRQSYPNAALHALLHDASEAYLGDVISPLKVLLPSYRELEARVQAAIWEAFELDAPDPQVAAAIKEADIDVYARECVQFRGWDTKQHFDHAGPGLWERAQGWELAHVFQNADIMGRLFEERARLHSRIQLT